MSDKIIWKSELRRIRDLHDYNNNPRQITKKAFKVLVDSLKSDGYHSRIMINRDGMIVGGHSRKKALLKAGYNCDDIIEVLVPSRELTPGEFYRINIRDNLPYGEYDFDTLSCSFEIDTLIDWGMSEDLLGLSETKEKKEKKPKVCPNCGESF